MNSKDSAHRNVLLRLAYDGTDFHGWQIQPDRPTVQGTLSSALEQLCGKPVEVCGSGRTDAGVHAREQAANVRIHSSIPCSGLQHALNRTLPEAIRILSAHEVPFDFHARHDAISKVYRYRIYNEAICPPWLSRYVYPYPYPLNEGAMEAAAQYFIGSHDFRSFAASDAEKSSDEFSSGRSFVRTVFSSTLCREGPELAYTIQGNGFLQHMVRNIVGALIDVGRGRTAPDSIPEIIAARNRSAAGPTAPARGLHLMCVSYPPEKLDLCGGPSGAPDGLL